jgi:hypothetical protein
MKRVPKNRQRRIARTRSSIAAEEAKVDAFSARASRFEAKGVEAAAHPLQLPMG